MPLLPPDVAVSLALFTDVTHRITKTLFIHLAIHSTHHACDPKLFLCEQTEAWRWPWLSVP